MPRRISSLLTFFHKFGLPVLFIISFLDVMVTFLTVRRPSSFLDMIFVFLVAILFVGYTVWLGWALKKVSIDNDNLYVSNYRKEITIPLSEIADVTEFLFSESRRVTIHLRKPTEFGQKIIFLATYRLFSFFSAHPIVEELRQIARSRV